MLISARAKVNLYLRVGSRRPDGYHDLQTIFHSVTLADQIEIVPAGVLRVECSDATIPSGPQNLAYRAAEALAAQGGVPAHAHISIHKLIPAQAGLGGGSADAAAVLVGLNEMWGLGASTEALQRLAASLGADAPFCVAGGAAYAEGIGDNLTPLPSLPETPLVIVMPPASVSTADAYRALDSRPRPAGPDPAPMLEAVRRRSVEFVAGHLFNDFQPVALDAFPEIRRAFDILQARVGPTLLCGSGAALFALPGSEEDALMAVQALQNDGYQAWRARFAPFGSSID